MVTSVLLTKLSANKEASTLALLLDDDRDEAVIDEDALFHFHHLGDVLVVHPQNVGGALLHVGIVCGDLDHVPSFETDLSTRALQRLHKAYRMYTVV